MLIYNQWACPARDSVTFTHGFHTHRYDRWRGRERECESARERETRRERERDGERLFSFPPSNRWRAEIELTLFLGQQYTLHLHIVGIQGFICHRFSCSSSRNSISTDWQHIWLLSPLHRHVGTIGRIDRWVVQQACCCLHRCRNTDTVHRQHGAHGSGSVMDTGRRSSWCLEDLREDHVLQKAVQLAQRERIVQCLQRSYWRHITKSYGQLVQGVEKGLEGRGVMRTHHIIIFLKQELTDQT